MKQLFLLLIFLATFSAVHAQDRYQFRTDAPQGFSIESSTKSALSLHYSIAELGIIDVQRDKAKGQEIILKGCFASNAEGLPNLPFVNQYIAVPQGAKVSVEVKEKASQTLQNIELLPAAPLKMNNESKRPELHWDMSVFGKDINYPSENVTIAQTTQIRGLDVAMVSVTPFRYNPIRKTLEVIYDMDIEVRFEGGNGQFGDPRYRNPAWDNILRDLVINSDMLPEAHYYDFLNQAIQNREEGCEYLIISPDDESILAWADTLKAFRTKQGILTKVVTTTECGGNDPETVRNYIVNAYNNWAIPPAAVLMFASSSWYSDYGINPFIYQATSNGHNYNYPTDNPFADMNGDSIPDLAISRFLAFTPADIEQMVRRTIDYELNPPTDDAYYDHPIVTSNYEEDKWFMITSQSVNGFFRNNLGKHPTNLYMMYDYFDEGFPLPDSIWSTDEHTTSVLDYYGPNGTSYIPASIGALNDWKDMDDYQLLIDAFNKESFLTFYRDHSGIDEWCAPRFFSYDVESLQNKKPTFLFSIGCLTNNYWSWGDCLIARFCQAEAGIIGGIGTASVTYSKYNDLVSWGMLDYIWPDFMPTLASNTQPQFVYPSFSLIAGKVFLYQQSFKPHWTEGFQSTMNLFGYTGETYLNLYTETPKTMSAEFNIFYADEQFRYPFTFEEGAKVCFSKDGEIFQVIEATGQEQIVVLPQMEFTLTATKQNRFRIEKDVAIIPTGQPYIFKKDVTFNDQDGNGQLDYGEYANIDLHLHNAGSVATEGADITLLCDSPFIDILQGTAHYPHIDADGEFNLQNAFKIKIADNIPDQTKIQFRLQFNEGYNTHSDSFVITANAPVVQISPDFSLTTEEGKPSTHIETEGKTTITFSISNIGHSTTCPISADLDIKAPFVNSEASRLLETLRPEETTTFSIDVNATPSDIEAGWLQAQLQIRYGTYQTSLNTIMQYGGIFENFETDTLNPFFVWVNNGENKWEYCDDNAYEGLRCFISNADTAKHSQLRARLRSKLIDHEAKISFYYKTDPNDSLTFYLRSFNESTRFSNPEWQYGEVTISSNEIWFNWYFKKQNIDNRQAMIDDICFPPPHTAITHAGKDMLLCKENPVELNDAYAYFCDSVRWITEGDGRFENNTLANTIYHPGSQDLTNGHVSLTILAFSGTDTLNSTTKITMLDEINFSGNILGDSLVNKYSEPVSHYSIEEQEGIIYHWDIEPTEAGTIYDYGNEIDIVWNLHEGDAEVTLSVTAENSCEVEPITKTISLIGYSTPEWQSVSFDLFPNPTTGTVNLVMGENLTGKTVVEVYNLLGQHLLTQNACNLRKGQTLTISLNGFVSGLYIITLRTENGCWSKKVSVK